VVGMVGLIEGRPPTPSAFQRPGDLVALLGDLTADPATLGGGTYLAALHGIVAGRPPRIDLDRERALQRLTLDAIAAGHIRSAHDCSDGGLAVALAECCIWSDFGLDGDMALPLAVDDPLAAIALLYGEAPSRIVVSLPPEHWDEMVALAAAAGLPITRLGTVGGDRLRFAPLLDVPVDELAQAWRGGLARVLGRGPVTAE